MCRIEQYNLIFPDGHVELRERVLNNCPRGTPGSPCHRREYTRLNRDRYATQADVDEYARNHAVVIAPSPYLTQQSDAQTRPEEHSLRRHKDHRGVLGGLSLELKLWNPFSSKSKKSNRTSQRREQLADQPTLIEIMPEAPMPPPAWVPRDDPKPRIVTREPSRKTKKTQEERKPKTSKKDTRGKQSKKPIIHQVERRSASDSESSSDSSEDERDSPSTHEPIRIHRRPQAERSSTPSARAAEAAKEARYQKERRDRDLRNAEAERLARQHAQRVHADVIRQENRRIRQPERRPLESEQIRRERQQREARVEEERARQERADIEAIRSQDARDRAVLRQPRGGRGVTLHQRGNSIEETGQSVLDDAIADARRRREESEASDATREGRGGASGLRRRNTTDGTRRSSSRDGRGGGHDRRRRGGGSG